MPSKKKFSGKKKVSFRNENEEKPMKRIRKKKVKYRGKNVWLTGENDLETEEE